MIRPQRNMFRYLETLHSGATQSFPALLYKHLAIIQRLLPNDVQVLIPAVGG